MEVILSAVIESGAWLLLLLLLAFAYFQGKGWI